MSVPESKVKSTREFVKTVTKKDLQSFLGTTGNSHSLTEVTKKPAP